MSDPLQPQQPFAPEGRSDSRVGCARAALIGCGALLLLLLVAVIVLFLNIERISAWGFDLMEKQVMARLPAETSEEDTERIRTGFAALVAAVRDETVDPVALNQLQPIILRFSDTSRRPTQEDVDALIDVLERASGLAPSESRRPAFGHPRGLPFSPAVTPAAA